MYSFSGIGFPWNSVKVPNITMPLPKIYCINKFPCTSLLQWSFSFKYIHYPFPMNFTILVNYDAKSFKLISLFVLETYVSPLRFTGNCHQFSWILRGNNYTFWLITLQTTIRQCYSMIISMITNKHWCRIWLTA